MRRKIMAKKSLTDEANEIVNGARNKAYGHPSKNFKLTADLWSVILGIPVTPEQVALCMIQLKIARELHSVKRDNLVDAIGYILTYEKVLEGDKNEQG
jgi:hypothetical protein